MNEEQVRLAKATAKNAARVIYEKNKRCGHKKNIRMCCVLLCVVGIIVSGVFCL